MPSKYNLFMSRRKKRLKKIRNIKGNKFKVEKPKIRIPTAKGSIAFADRKKYNRKRNKKLIKREIEHDS